MPLSILHLTSHLWKPKKPEETCVQKLTISGFTLNFISLTQVEFSWVYDECLYLVSDMKARTYDGYWLSSVFGRPHWQMEVNTCGYTDLDSVVQTTSRFDGSPLESKKLINGKITKFKICIGLWGIRHDVNSHLLNTETWIWSKS